MWWSHSEKFSAHIEKVTRPERIPHLGALVWQHSWYYCTCHPELSRLRCRMFHRAAVQQCRKASWSYRRHCETHWCSQHQPDIPVLHWMAARSRLLSSSCRAERPGPRWAHKGLRKRMGNISKIRNLLVGWLLESCIHLRKFWHLLRVSKIFFHSLPHPQQNKWGEVL